MKKVFIPILTSIVLLIGCGKEDVEPEKVKFERPPDKVDTIPIVITIPGTLGK